MRRVALIGHCGPDASYLRMAVAAAGPQVQVVAVDDEESLRRLLDASDQGERGHGGERGLDLLLFNRMLDYGFPEEEGVAVIQRLRRHFPHVKMMLVSNYPEAQAAAVAAGAVPGFGKRDIGTPRVKEILRQALA